MRRNRRLRASDEATAEGVRARQSEPHRGALRRAQWSSYYHRFFGRVRNGDRVPDSVAPVSLDASTDLLDETFDPRRPEVARRCVSQMLVYGYRPADDRREQFDRLTRKVADACHPSAEPSADDDAAAHAKALLLSWAEREFAPTAVSIDQVREEIRRAPREVRMISCPTRLTHDRGAFVVVKDVYLRTRLTDVSALVNPENWEALGDFFARTYREGTLNDEGMRPAKAWQGVLHEDFVVSWNSVTTSVFKQRLKIDYSVGADLVRTDYALMYEEDDQVTVNEGFLEVRHRADDELPKDWIAGTMQKKVKFTSSVLNLLCPALLSMLLDSKAGGFNRFVNDAGGERAAVETAAIGTCDNDTDGRDVAQEVKDGRFLG
jgi:hypothetical protein